MKPNIIVLDHMAVLSGYKLYNMSTTKLVVMLTQDQRITIKKPNSEKNLKKVLCQDLAFFPR